MPQRLNSKEPNKKTGIKKSHPVCLMNQVDKNTESTWLLIAKSINKFIKTAYKIIPSHKN